MANRDLQDIFNSGEITSIRIGGTGIEKEVITQEDLDTAGHYTADYIDFDTALVDNPAHAEGRLFYEKSRKALTYHTDVDGELISIGRELVMYVKNVDTTPLYPGDCVYCFGAENGIPTVKKAIADGVTPTSAIVIGVASFDIPVNSFGYITTAGILKGLNMSLYIQGQILYLSETVAGRYTTSPGDIVTVVGVVTSNVTDGAFNIQIVNFRAFPNIIGWLYGKSSTMTVTTSPQEVLGFLNSESIRIPVEAGLGRITIKYTGIYRLNVSMTIIITPTTGFRDLTIQLYDQTNSTVVKSAIFSVARDTDKLTLVMTLPVNLTINHVYVLRMLSDINIVITSFDDINYDIESIRYAPGGV